MYAEKLTVTSKGVEAKGINMTTKEFGMALACGLSAFVLTLLVAKQVVAKQNCPAIPQ